jgi:hypothetical protein
MVTTTTGDQLSNSDAVTTRRRNKITTPVKPPLSEIRLRTFLYVIGFLALAYALWSGYTMAGLKLQEAKNLKENIQGKNDNDQPVQPVQRTVVENHGEASGGNANVEAKIAELAALLGVPAVPLASAVAEAIKPYIPEASSSSLSDAVKETNSILSAFVGGMETSSITSAEGSEATSVLFPGAVTEAAKSVLAAVGFDDGGVDEM